MSADDKLLDLNDHALVALGGYIGPATREDIVAAIVGHTTGPVIAQVATSGGEVIWRREGWPCVYDGWMNAGDEDHDGDDEDRTDIIVFDAGDAQHERRETVFSGVRVFTDIPLMIELPRDRADRYEVHRHAGGFRVWLAGSMVLSLVLWHSVQHVTDSGDVAPGFGPFEVTSLEPIDEEQRTRDELDSAEEHVADWSRDGLTDDELRTWLVEHEGMEPGEADERIAELREHGPLVRRADGEA